MNAGVIAAGQGGNTVVERDADVRLPVAIAQFAPGDELAANFTAIRELAAQAAAAGARVTIMPEASMLAVPDMGERERAEGVAAGWQPFRELLADEARRHGMWIAAGGFEPGEDTARCARPYNTLLVVDPQGQERAAYRKLHMYDAFAFRESDAVAPGNEPAPVVEVEGLRIGFLSCYDLRFPELSRDLAARGAEVLVCVAAWVRGPLKEAHWDVLTRARAIENTAWLVACGSVKHDCIGSSRIIDPLGVVRAGLGPRERGVAVLALNAADVRETREILPSLANRRMRGGNVIDPAG